MALTSTAVWQVENSANGSDTLNAGYFNAGGSSAGTDFSITAPIACTDLAVDATLNTQVTSATISFDATHIRNGLRITAGTGFTQGLYEITAVSGGKATLDRSPGATSITGGTARVGGAFASPGGCGAFLSSAQNPTIYIKNTGTTYSLSNSINVAAGKLRVYGAGQAFIVGYLTTRTTTNTDVGPTLAPSANSVSYLASGFNGVLIYNLICDNSVSAKTGSGGIALDDISTTQRCQAISMATGFLVVGEFGSGNRPTFLGCYASGCTTSYAASAGIAPRFIGCVAVGGTGDHFGSTAGETVYWHCISKTCATGGVPFRAAVSGHTWIGCVCYNPFSDGFQPAADVVLINCVCYGQGFGGGGGYGFKVDAITSGTVMLGCAAGSGGSGRSNALASYDLFPVTLTGDPFTSASGGDFSLNNTSGAGAALRAVGYPISFFGISTTNYLDIGAAQHQGAAAVSAFLGTGNMTANFEG